MPRGFFYYFQFAVIMSVVTATGIIYAQYERSYGGYPASSSNSVYIANREMMPQSAFLPPSTNPAKPSENAPSVSPATSATSVTPAAPFIPAKNTEPENKEQSETTKKSSFSKVKSYFSSLFYPSKNTKSSQESKDKESLEDIDDGQEMIEALRKEQSYSAPDYVNSATQSNTATAKDFYKQGLDFEVQGDFPEAVRSYNAFIAANKKQTINGTLAAPYHRLALIAWKQSEIRNAGIYFRYAMKYALGGNVPIIAGDFALFLMERNDLKQAEVILRNALIHYPENNRLLYYLGRCTAHQNKPIEAIRYFSVSVGEEQAYHEMALLYRQWGDFDRAKFLEDKREEYLAKRNTMTPQPSFASQPANINVNTNTNVNVNTNTNAHIRPNVNAPYPVHATIPTTPPPVMSNPRGGILSRGTMETSVPFPTFNNPAGRSEQVFTNTNNQGMLPPQHVNPIPAESWQPLNLPPASPVSMPISPMPVSKVFHYPADQVVPTYYEFQGDQYPKNSPPANANVVQTSFVP
ncbi:MAG: tetratricopeptide repeat protein [Planctomycetaceae bacterium]|jgi:tetratricopeptide (TPR) repeat protein|nr:tetratricopeptide repeat protein [Planctomycetaceae bacterium]